ncbi:MULTISPECIES: LexA family protein [Holdemania]|uniref:LexA family protein n=1 Tax=Holdemania TaxID=61170 RepID=UPI001E359B19|nr:MULTISPECIES: S24 family peptidase [Holdemania]MCQ4953025.1 helix-turn-helix domain-containing protein [Holdemania filiformis]
MKIKDVLKARRKELKLTLMDIAKACDVSEGTVSRWESGDIGDMKRSRIAALAKILQISPAVIVGSEEDEDLYKSVGIGYIRIPLYSSLCCGNGGFNDDNIIEYIPVPSKGLNTDPDNYFCQIAFGESMKDAGINTGDLLIFEKTAKVDIGVIGCFCVDENEAMCKKFNTLNGIIMLQPMNSDFEPVVIDPVDECFRCLGKLKKVIKDFE